MIDLLTLKSGGSTDILRDLILDLEVYSDDTYQKNHTLSMFILPTQPHLPPEPDMVVLDTVGFQISLALAISIVLDCLDLS